MQGFRFYFRCKVLEFIFYLAFFLGDLYVYESSRSIMLEDISGRVNSVLEMNKSFQDKIRLIR